MRIQHNIMAMNAYRNYNNNTSALSKNLEKLSSGYKINRAGDDAAGLAISEKMRAQITGLDKAQDNAKDGISLVQTAEGALTEVHDMLNRMYSLAEQSANGTYEDETDRLQLEKEVNQLKAEIDRIADSANFNGIELLDGSLAKADGVTVGGITVADVVAGMTGNLGTVDSTKAFDGVLSAPTEEVQYSAKFYVGDITNNNAADKNIVFTYKDNTGTDKTVTITIEAGKTATTQEIADALSESKSGGVKAAVDNGTAFADGTKSGKFADLYDVSVDGNIITITAKKSEAAGTGEVIDGSKLGTGTTAWTNTLDTADVEAAEAALKEKYNGTEDTIKYGSAAGEATKHVAAKDGSYQVASSQLALETTKTGTDFHNMGITVGDVTYIIQSGTQKMSDKTPEEDGANVKYVKVEDSDTATDVAQKLAAAISADENTHGIVATANTGILTISESTQTGAEHIGSGDAGKAADLFKLESYEKVAAIDNAVNGTIKLDAAALRNGTTIQVGDKSYMLTSDPNLRAPDSNTTVITYNKDATSAEIAQALADQLTADGATGVTVADDTVTFTDATLSGVEDPSDISATGSGLVLQIGDTSDSYNQLQVTIKDTHVEALGLDDMSIADQDSAAAALDQIKSAINYVSDVRGTLGATQNRLDHTINNLSVMQENIQDAESTIRDTDIADEMMAYTKNNILIQSAQAMLAQANQVPQGVLQLLQ